MFANFQRSGRGRAWRVHDVQRVIADHDVKILNQLAVARHCLSANAGSAGPKVIGRISGTSFCNALQKRFLLIDCVSSVIAILG